MALAPITELIAALKDMGLPGIAPARIGAAVPRVPGDLPRLRVVASELAFAPMGIGGSRIARPGPGGAFEEERCRRITGTLDIEVWAADEDAVNGLALAVAEGVAAREIGLLAAGFLRLRQSRWEAAEEAPLRGAQNAKALRQALAYSIVFEDVEKGPVGEGVIQRIDIAALPAVDPADPGFEEDFDVRKGRDVP